MHLFFMLILFTRLKIIFSLILIFKYNLTVDFKYFLF